MVLIPKASTPIVKNLPWSTKIGVVVSAGKMDRAVKVRIAGQEWNKKFKKHFPSPITHLVSDPQNSVVEGDVVRITSGWRTSKNIRHVISAIVAPFGAPVEERPPVLTAQQRMQIRIQDRIAKDVRSAAKGRIVSRLRLERAKKQGYTIPDLETAMANVKIVEAAQEELKEGGKNKTFGKEAHLAMMAKMATNKKLTEEIITGLRDTRVANERVAQEKKEIAMQKRAKSWKAKPRKVRLQKAKQQDAKPKEVTQHEVKPQEAKLQEAKQQEVVAE